MTTHTRMKSGKLKMIKEIFNQSPLKTTTHAECPKCRTKHSNRLGLKPLEAEEIRFVNTYGRDSRCMLREFKQHETKRSK